MAKGNTEAARFMVLPRAAKARRTSAQAWIERTNPLTRLSLRAAQSIYDTARGGGYARLQYIYAEIEKTDPTLFTCVDRRLSALSALGWRVVANVEGAAAAAQKKRLEDMLSGAAGLAAAIEHMGLAFFRGFSFCEPYMRSGRLAFNCPPSWEFNRSPDGTWWHNPLVIEGDAGGEGQRAFDPEAVIHIERVRAVDYPALALYLRHEVAEDQWGRFLERYGIPPVILEMPPLTQPGDADRFAQAAQQVYEALCGAVPNGTKVNTLAEARGADPFSGFIEHQEKAMVRLCTGGTLGSIAEATGIGSGASAAQGDVWREIVARDAVLIGEEFTRWFGRFVFPEGMLVRFELGTEKRATPDEVFETAAKARQAGYRFTKEYLETETGAELENDAATLLPGPFGGIAANKSPATPLQNRENRLQNAPRDLDGQREGLEAETRLRPFLAALRNDVKPIAAEVEDLLGTLEAEGAGSVAAEKAKALIDKLPDLVPSDPALAAAIAEEMAEAYGAAWEESRAKARGSDAKIVSNSGTSEGAKKGWATRRRNGWTPERLDENRQKAANLAKEALSDRQSNRTESLGPADGQEADDIKAAIGIDVAGYEHRISSKDIRHADKRHGAQRVIDGRKLGERSKDQIPLTGEDFERIPDLYSGYDRIEPGKPEENTGLPSVRYIKKFPDGMLYGVDVVVENDRTLRYKTGWKKRI